ncbi:MAG: Ig-like domain-containing protein [Chloroflexi bacterium]|nr:Ig-like domain-containing protein [Chloroflexota bacterium]MBT7080618.1 Ig-like domain-containing protein [Chloroflexota bacterium]
MYKIQKYVLVCVAVLALSLITACNSVTPGEVPESITVTPADTAIRVAGSQQYMAVAYYADGRTANITDDVIWSSTNGTAIAHMDELGLVRAYEKGTFTIKAQLGDLTDSTTLIVTLTTPEYPLPNVPLDHYPATLCSACHSEGVAGAPLFPDTHTDYTNQMCDGCHPAG